MLRKDESICMTKMQEYTFSEVVEIPVAMGISFDELDDVVHAFNTSVVVAGRICLSLSRICGLQVKGIVNGHEPVSSDVLCGCHVI